MGAARVLADQSGQSIRDRLRQCQLFAEVDEAAVEFIAPFTEALFCARGEPIILENEINDHVYFVSEGSVEILNFIVNEKRAQRLALLKPGQQFAEFSVLNKSTKSGSAYAYEDAQLLRVPGAKFIELVQRFPSVSKKLAIDLAFLNERVESAHDFIPFFQPSMMKIQREITDLIPLAQWKRFGIIPFSLHGGLMSVAMKDASNEEFFQFAKGTFPKIGVNVFLIDEDDYDGALEKATAAVKAGPVKPAAPPPGLPKDIKQVLDGFPLTRSLPENVRAQMAGYLEFIDFKAGTVFSDEGITHDAICIIQSGLIDVSRAVPQGKGRAHVMQLGPGETFGEVSLITMKPSLHSYRAIEDTVIMPIPKTIIDQLLGKAHLSLPLAQWLGRRLQKLNGSAGMRYFRGGETPDFATMAKKLPVSIMNEHKIFPLKEVDGEISLGLVKPNHKTLLSLLNRYLSDVRVRFLGITEQQFQSFMHHSKNALENGSTSERPNLRSQGSGPTKGIDPVKFLNEVLVHGMSSRTSDLHFEPTEHYMTIRYRVDGVLNERPEKIPTETARELVSRIKILSGMDIGTMKSTQDGQLKTEIDGVQIIARASILPLKHGEKVVLRLMRSQGTVTPLNMLVPDRRVIRVLQQVAKTKQGLFLVTGPTGSGKTTTLYSLLSEINRIGVNVVTLEDPVELEIPGCNQCEVDRKRGVDFAHVLRTVLRQDPDVVMIGEIRDEESAKIVFEAAVTGHLVLSTLHTSFAMDVGPRLEELGVPKATIATGLLGVLTQRLVRGICKKCSVPHPITEGEKQFIQEMLPKVTEFPTELRSGKGCSACNNTGYYDRIPVVEVWRNTLAMREALYKDAGPEELETIAREDGFET
ncbi:MAG TPA: ATPase, T2SS/T4P/T4SS family, partial [Bdellovibrionales bacterium]|nr:ATPase, T2SS/T4P/T4SS family [Bdellovibrionales bacterium]